ncbi:MAG: ribonuclease P protein component [Pseudomonadota bacterium]
MSAALPDPVAAPNIRPVPTLKARAEFRRVDRGAKWVTPGFILRAIPNQTTRVGYTVSKKVGNAVVRNRVKRRLRALVADAAKDAMLFDADLVLIGRRPAFDRPFAALTKDFREGLSKVERRLGKARP